MGHKDNAYGLFFLMLDSVYWDERALAGRGDRICAAYRDLCIRLAIFLIITGRVRLNCIGSDIMESSRCSAVSLCIQNSHTVSFMADLTFFETV